MKLPPTALRLEVLLLLVVWFAIGLTLNSRDLDAFNLQQMGVESIVDRGVFYVEGSRSPKLQPIGDVFDYNGHKYAAKQPGQFFIGAIFYFFLSLLGLNYVDNYLLTSALVTFSTASLITAVSAVAVFRIAKGISKPSNSDVLPLSIAFTYAFATTVLPYAGIAHHDSIASAYLVIAFYVVFEIAHGAAVRGLIARALLAGIFLGLTVTTSMLVFWSSMAVGLYFLSLRRWRLVPYFILGGFLGLLPLLFYDAYNFGNPFLLPNVAGNYNDTFFYLSLTNIREKIVFYSTATFMYAPVVLAALIGLFLLPRRFLREKLAIIGTIFFLTDYIFNIDTVGTCEYGPRYLLPVMGLSCLGLAGFTYIRSLALRISVYVVVALIAAVSLVVNIVGAVGGTMYCDLAKFAFWPHLKMLLNGQGGSMPLFYWLIVPATISAIVLTTEIAFQTLRSKTPAVPRGLGEILYPTEPH